MKSDLGDITALARETTRMALHHAMAVEMAEENRERTDLWGTAAEMAMDAKYAALMTINSTMIENCRKYREEHGRTGYIDIEENVPGPALREHQCQPCQPLQQMARHLNETLWNLWRTDYRRVAQSGDRERNILPEMHSALLGQVHMAVAMSLEQYSPAERPE